MLAPRFELLSKMNVRRRLADSWANSIWMKITSWHLKESKLCKYPELHQRRQKLEQPMIKVFTTATEKTTILIDQTVILISSNIKSKIWMDLWLRRWSLSVELSLNRTSTRDHLVLAMKVHLLRRCKGRIKILCSWRLKVEIPNNF